MNKKEREQIKNELEERSEVRFLETEVRAGESENPVIVGKAAVYEQETVIGEMFREVIREGAFSNVLSRNPDVVCVPNHNLDTVLARTISRTLTLTHEKDGLKYEAQINKDDSEALNIYARVKRGDVRQSSFRFTVQSDRWVYPERGSNDLPLREILEIGELYDVSPVTFPGYPTTTAAVRSKISNLQQEETPDAGDQAGPEGSEDQKAEDERQARQKARQRRIQLAEIEVSTRSDFIGGTK